MLTAPTTLFISTPTLTSSASIDPNNTCQPAIWATPPQRDWKVGFDSIPLSTNTPIKSLTKEEQIVMHKALLASVDIYHRGELI